MGVRTTPDAMAEIKAAIAHYQNKIFEVARKAGLRDRFEAYAADALVEMARASVGQIRKREAQTGPDQDHRPHRPHRPGPRPRRTGGGV